MKYNSVLRGIQGRRGQVADEHMLLMYLKRAESKYFQLVVFTWTDPACTLLSPWTHSDQSWVKQSMN